MSSHKRTSGFTLIELSIVLVVIALLIGGILAARDLIRAAKIRQSMSQKDQIVQSVTTFRIKYNCLPGDCINATDFFGADPEGCPGSGGKTPKTQTCNGNGRGNIGFPQNEAYYFWQHLSAAGFWSGLFRGIWTSSGGTDSTTYAATAISNDYLWFVSPASIMGGVPMINGQPYINHFLIALPADPLVAYSTDPAVSPILFRPPEMQAIDTKYDDGKPASGRVMIDNGGMDVTICINVNGTNSTYLTTTGTGNCMPTFPNVF
jgi:prepilin-type N-terminal cleavage/methylation domain-containing protein